MDQVQKIAIEEYQKRIEEDYLSKFQEYVGADPYSTDTYSENAFKEMMARTITFWKRLHDEIEETSPELEYRKQFTFSMFEESVKYVNETMSPEQIEFITNRAEQLQNNERHKAIENCRKKLQVITKVSNGLYQGFSEALLANDPLLCKCVIILLRDIIDNDVRHIKTVKREPTTLDLFEPTIWLVNQDLMTSFINKYESHVKTLNNYEELLDNLMFKYFKFMCTNYPTDYSHILMEQHAKNECFDGAELYYEMTK